MNFLGLLKGHGQERVARGDLRAGAKRGTGWPVQTVLPPPPPGARTLYTIAQANAQGKKLMKKLIKKIILFKNVSNFNDVHHMTK